MREPARNLAETNYYQDLHITPEMIKITEYLPSRHITPPMSARRIPL